MSEHNTGHQARLDRNIWPGLTSSDPLALRAFLVGLGFDEGGCYFVDGHDGDTHHVQHSEMLWPEGGRVMISSTGKSDDTFSKPTGTGNLYVVTADPDTVHERAVALDAPFLREMREEDYGSRGFSVSDPDGNAWSFGTYAG